MSTSCKTACGLALLAAASVAVPASAYPNGLTLGQKGTPVSGTATLSSSGTLASGTFQYDDANNNPAALNPSQNSFDALLAYGNSSVTISGGSLYTLATYDNSIATVSGGTVNGLSAADSSTINVTGLSRQSLGAAFLFGTTGSSTIDLFGTGFTISPTMDANQFLIKGTLLDGGSLTGTYFNSGGRLLFNGLPAPIPEASTMVSLGLLLALGGLIVTRRRKTALR